MLVWASAPWKICKMTTLAKDMERRMDEMKQVVRECASAAQP